MLLIANTINSSIREWTSQGHIYQSLVQTQHASSAWVFNDPIVLFHVECVVLVWVLLLGNKLPSRTMVCSYVFVWYVGGGSLMWCGEHETLSFWDFSKYTCLRPLLRKFDKLFRVDCGRDVYFELASLVIWCPFWLRKLIWWSCYILLKWSESTWNPRKLAKKKIK